MDNKTKIFLYVRIIKAMDKIKTIKNNNYSLHFHEGLLMGMAGAFIYTDTYYYLSKAINELDINAVYSLMYYDCDNVPMIVEG